MKTLYKSTIATVALGAAFLFGHLEGRMTAPEKILPEYHIEIHRQKNHIMAIDLYTSMIGLENNQIRIRPNGTIEDMTRNNQERLQVHPYMDYASGDAGITGKYDAQITLTLEQSLLPQFNGPGVNVCNEKR